MKGLEQLHYYTTSHSALHSKVAYTYNSVRRVLKTVIELFLYAHNFIIWCF